MINQVDKKYLSPTSIIDSDHEKITEYARDTIGDTTEDKVEMAVKLYYAVRDGIRYDAYHPFHLPEHYRASNILKIGSGFCVPKASLLCALGRACGIPTRVGFATVRNHLAAEQLMEHVGSDLVIYHGFTEFYLEGRWVKATPAFNIELCRMHNVTPLEFNGREDSIFHAYNLEKKQFMEYLEFHETYADIPVDTIVNALEEGYGKDRVKKMIDDIEKAGAWSAHRLDDEEVIKRGSSAN
ncbi:MAG: transglutaminase-like domain-containing protein [Pseudomonadota bacterium]